MTPDYSDEYLIFVISSELFGIKLSEVMGVVQYQKCTGFPLLKENFIGFVKIDGTPVPLIDLITATIGGQYQPVLDDYIITVKFRCKLVGLLVNDVKRIIKIDRVHGNTIDESQPIISWQEKDLPLITVEQLVGGNIACELRNVRKVKTL